jgi:hypothetical protein
VDANTLGFFFKIFGRSIVDANTRVCEGLHLSKSRYIFGLLARTKMSHAKPITSPMATNTSLNQFSRSTFNDVTLYRSTAGMLQYLSFTRPNIVFVVNKMS